MKRPFKGHYPLIMTAALVHITAKKATHCHSKSASSAEQAANFFCRAAYPSDRADYAFDSCNAIA